MALSCSSFVNSMCALTDFSCPVSDRKLLTICVCVCYCGHASILVHVLFFLNKSIFIRKCKLHVDEIDAGPNTFQCQVFHITYILVHIVADTNHFDGGEGGGGGGGGGVHGKEMASNSQPF